jgi:superfamily II DNA or RNA helicase
MIELRPYQKNGIDELTQKINSNRSVLFQLATGGGKTFIFSFFVKKWLEENEGNVLILVHRKELLHQTMQSLAKIGVDSENIDADNKNPAFAGRVFVAMVQTIQRRLQKNEDYCPAKLVIVDECHRQDFNKVFEFYKESKLVGFSATPISVSKKYPLKNYYQEIVCCADVKDLLEIGSLTNNKTYTFKNGVKRNEIKKNSFGEFSNQSMLDQFGNPQMLQNTIKAYENFCKDQKTLIFNVSVEHSKAVCEAFKEKGYECMHLDGESQNRDKILDWFAKTENAILCNIDILTTGFDEPSIKNIIVNRSTTSLPLWLQMTGRGGRLYPNKDYFNIIDLGENVQTHGDWSEERNWKHLFFEPKKYKEGAAPIKECPECGYINYASARICGECEYEYPKKQNPEITIFELALFENSKKSNLKNIHETVVQNGNKPARTVHILQNNIVKEGKKFVNKMGDDKDIFVDSMIENFENEYKKLHLMNKELYKNGSYNKAYWREQLLEKIKNEIGC